MSEGGFEREVLDRLITIETKIEAMAEDKTRINDLEVAQARIEQSAKAAHHRINSIYKIVGIIATAITLLINVIAFVLSQSVK